MSLQLLYAAIGCGCTQRQLSRRPHPEHFIAQCKDHDENRIVSGHVSLYGHCCLRDASARPLPDSCKFPQLTSVPNSTRPVLVHLHASVTGCQGCLTTALCNPYQGIPVTTFDGGGLNAILSCCSRSHCGRYTRPQRMAAAAAVVQTAHSHMAPLPGSCTMLASRWHPGAPRMVSLDNTDHCGFALRHAYISFLAFHDATHKRKRHSKCIAP